MTTAASSLYKLEKNLAFAFASVHAGTIFGVSHSFLFALRRLMRGGIFLTARAGILRVWVPMVWCGVSKKTNHGSHHVFAGRNCESK